MSKIRYFEMSTLSIRYIPDFQLTRGTDERDRRRKNQGRGGQHQAIIRCAEKSIFFYIGAFDMSKISITRCYRKHRYKKHRHRGGFKQIFIKHLGSVPLTGYYSYYGLTQGAPGHGTIVPCVVDLIGLILPYIRAQPILRYLAPRRYSR